MQIVCRVSQARAACRFNFRLSYATTFTQHSVRATAKKTFSVGDLFTALYSTIFAVAALADSKAKERRLHEWDQLIAETRESLKARKDGVSEGVSLRQESYGLACPIRVPATKKFTSSRIKDRRNAYFEQTTWHRKGLEKGRATFCRKLTFSIAQYHSKSNPISLDRSEVISNHEEFVHEDVDLDAPERDISDPAELKLLQSNINSLVSRLLSLSSIDLRSQTNDAAVNDSTSIQDQLENIKKRLLSLEDTIELLPLYTFTGQDMAQKQCQELNAILWRICKKANIEKASLNLMVAKICYNLLISAVPPNIETYNILLNELALLECFYLAEEVLQSFWYSRLRPNKKTIQLIILHYKATKDKDGLTALVKMMRGADGNLMLNCVYAKKHRAELSSTDGPKNILQDFDPHAPSTRTNMRKHRLFYRFGFLYKKSMRDEKIFDALITAHFEIKGMRSAIRYISAAVREGSDLKVSTLCAVIKSSIQRADFTSGLKLLMIILSQWTLSGYHEHFKFLPVVRHHIYRLLCFCGIDPTKGVNGHLPWRITKYTESLVKREIEYPKEALRKMLCVMKVESLKESLGRISEVIENVFKIMNLGDTTTIVSNSCLMHRIEEALRVLESVTAIQENERNELDFAVSSGMALNLETRGLQANVVTSFSKMEEVAMNLVMVRVQVCASKLNLLAHELFSRKGTQVRVNVIKNLSIQLGILFKQLRIEIHLNTWWTRRLGLSRTQFRASVQRRRLEFLEELLNHLELRTNFLWEECAVVNHAMEDHTIFRDSKSNHLVPTV